MNKQNAWNKFEQTGNVLDYLAYRMENSVVKEQEKVEVHDRRSDNKREQCR